MSSHLFFGGEIVTMDVQTAGCEAVVIEQERIVAVGKLDELRARFPEAQALHLLGKTLLPGFIDAHSHILWAAKTRGEPVVDIRAITESTFAKILGKIKRRVAAAKAGECLVFFGLDAQLHPDMVEPDRAMLDAIAPDNPIAVQTSNCHAVYLNSAGLELCKLNRDSEDKPGGIIVRDDSGMPTGKVLEATTWEVLDIFYRVWGKLRLSTAFAESAQAFLRQGITTLTEHLYLPYYQVYYRAARVEGIDLPRIAAYQQATSANMLVDRLSSDDDRMWMAGVKMHADGSPFIGNIWLSEPYLESDITIERMHLKPGHTGSINYPREYLTEMIHSYAREGWQISVHTQGDRTIEMVLDIVAEMIEQKLLAPDHRFRLEHCALMRAEQIARAHALGVACSFFISHIRYWGAVVEDYLFGPERAAHYMPAGSAVAAGMPISLHADTPMTDASALGLMQTAMTRQTLEGRVIGGSESISCEAALRAVTIDAAWQLRMEDKVGSISVGKYADLVVLQENPLRVDPVEIEQIQICQTWIGGKSVYQAD